MPKNYDKNFFDIKRLPMDMARIVCIPLLLIFRMKRIDTNGNKYKEMPKGAAVIASNHTGFLDPFLTGVCFYKRRMYFLASEEVMGPKFRAFLLRGVGCIKIDRKRFDLAGIKTAVNVLKKKQSLLTIYPQGGIQKDEEFSQVKNGAALIALQSNSPIIPIYIPKKDNFFSRRVAVVGNAIDTAELCNKKMPSMQDIENVSLKMLEGLNQCRKAYNTYIKG